MQPFIVEKKEQIAELCRTHHVRRLAVFGSAVRDDFDEARSDVDLLVSLEAVDPRVAGRALIELQAKFERLFARNVDLVAEGSIQNSVRLRNINRDQVQIYAA